MGPKKAIRAPSNTTLSTPKVTRRARTKTKMAIKNRRNSVGTTQKPTSTNKIKRMLKVQRTSTSKRKEELATRKETIRTAVMRAIVRARPETIRAGRGRSGSRPIPSRTMRTDTSAET